MKKTHYENAFLHILKSSVFVAIAFWILFLMDPLLIILDVNKYQKNKIHVWFLHGLNTLVLLANSQYLNINSYAIKNSLKLKFYNRFKETFALFTCFSLMQLFYYLNYGKHLYPFLNKMNFNQVIMFYTFTFLMTSFIDVLIIRICKTIN